MAAYFDIHSHILPGIDDGASDMEETLRMLSIAYEEGIRVITATPHYIPGKRNHAGQVQEVLEKVLKAYGSSCLNELQIVLGNELLYSSDLFEDLKKGKALTIDQTRYILIEFMFSSTFRQIRDGLNYCSYAGYIPILAHAERYTCLVRKPEQVEELIRVGAYIQLNFSCFTRPILDPKTAFGHKLLKNGWVHFLGTDAHGAEERTPHIKKAVEIIIRKYGEELVNRLVWENPMTMLENRHL